MLTNTPIANDNSRRAYKKGEGYFVDIDGTPVQVSFRSAALLCLTDKERGDGSKTQANQAIMSQFKAIKNTYGNDEKAINDFRLSLIDDVVDSGLLEHILDKPAPMAAAA